jgi:hypothetical protein
LLNLAQFSLAELSEPGPTAQRFCNLRAEASIHKDGTMLCNASTGDGGGAFNYAMTQFFILGL